MNYRTDFLAAPQFQSYRLFLTIQSTPTSPFSSSSSLPPAVTQLWISAAVHPFPRLETTGQAESCRLVARSGFCPVLSILTYGFQLGALARPFPAISILVSEASRLFPLPEYF